MSFKDFIITYLCCVDPNNLYNNRELWNPYHSTHILSSFFHIIRSRILQISPLILNNKNRSEQSIAVVFLTGLNRDSWLSHSTSSSPPFPHFTLLRRARDCYFSALASFPFRVSAYPCNMDSDYRNRSTVMRNNWGKSDPCWKEKPRASFSH